jgi:hypothetical protein
MKQWMQHKAVRITAWILLILTSLLMVLMIVVQVYISAHKTDLLARIHEEINKRLKGKVTIKEMDVNVWRHFPKVEIILRDVLLTDSLYQRPLLSVAEASTRIGLLDVTGKTTSIRMVKLANGNFHVFTDSTGYTNKYLLQLKPPPLSDTAVRKKVMIDEIVLENITAISEDAVKNKRFEILFHKVTARINKRDSLMELDLRENVLIKGLGFNLERGSYLANKTMEGRWKILYNTTTKELSFPATAVKINKHPFSLQGAFLLQDSLGHFDLRITVKKVRYKEAASLLTERLQQKLLLVNLEKPLDATVSISGGLGGGSKPLVNVSWTTVNNRLVTPVALLDSCSFSGLYTNELVQGMPRISENSQIVIKNFTGKWGGAVFRGSNITLTNLVEAELAFDLYSDCSFPALNDQFGLKSLRFVEGQAKLELHYKGPLVKDASFLHNVSGRLALQNGAVNYEDRDLLFTHCNGEIQFGADSLQVKQLQCMVGNNQFTVNIDGKEMGGLAWDDPHKAVISCSLYTPSLDLADFRHLFKGHKKTAAQRKRDGQNTTRTMLSFDEILEKGSLRLNIKADAIKLNHFTATALTGEILFRHEDWQLQRIAVQHAGGSLLLKGDIQHLENGSQHQANISMGLKDVDVRKVFYAFDNFGQKGITHSNLQGKLNTTANLRLALNDRGSIVPNSMNGKVWFSLRDGALINHEPVQRIQKFVFKDRDMRNITFAALQDSLIIVNDEIEIRRMEIHSSVMTLYVEGVYSLKDKTDISIQVPLHNFLARGDEKEPQNKGTRTRMGPSIYLRAKSDLKGNIKLGLDLFKKFRKRNKEKTGE